MEHLSKNKLRSKYASIRNGISPERKKSAETLLFSTLTERLQSFSVVASFISFRSEIDTSRINTWILEKKQLVIPRIEQTGAFYHIMSMSDLEKHPLGFYHPKEGCLKAAAVDCILVPGLAFDEEGYRLGYGKGAYDRLLLDWPGVPTIGIGFKEQKISQVPREEHDVPLSEVLLV